MLVLVTPWPTPTIYKKHIFVFMLKALHQIGSTNQSRKHLNLWITVSRKQIWGNPDPTADGDWGFFVVREGWLGVVPSGSGQRGNTSARFFPQPRLVLLLRLQYLRE